MSLDLPTRWDARFRPSHNTSNSLDPPALVEWNCSCPASKVTCMEEAVIRTASVAASRQDLYHTTVMQEAKAVGLEAELWLWLILADRSAVMAVQFCTLVSRNCPKDILTFTY